MKYYRQIYKYKFTFGQYVKNKKAEFEIKTENTSVIIFFIRELTKQFKAPSLPAFLTPTQPFGTPPRITFSFKQLDLATVPNCSL